MCENVNINVSETNETINIVATEVQEVIDINVFETAEDVTLNITEQLIQVNVNKVTAAEQIQSDWAQTDNEALDFIKNKPTIPANTSDLINDGEDGVNPFITANDIPPVTGFVPYTGATEDVNLGEFGLLTGNVEFDNTPTNIPTTAGAMYWNDADGTADLILKGGNVKLQIGQESVIRVVNKTATNINLLEANYQAVRVTGAQGQRLKVDLAQATNDNLSAETIGLVTETINNNQEGFITTSGLVRNINTTGSLQGETWADGDILYLSATTAGNVTKVKPTAPNHLVIIGYVVHAHANQGSIFVKVDNGYELDELHNVKITSAANNNVLAYTSATDIWENKTVETALGYTPFQLPSLTSGSVLFSDGTTIAQDNSNLFWDDTNNRLGIGTATPDRPLHINSAGITGLRIDVNDNGNAIFLGTQTSVIRWSNGSYFNNKGIYSGTNDQQYITFDGTNTQVRLQIKASNGNVQIGTTTDAGFRLDVNGTARILSSLTVTGNIVCGTSYASTGGFSSMVANYDTGSSAVTGNYNGFGITRPFNPTSGVTTYNGFHFAATINQTGTATGITRGLYINPTLTAAADFRAIENSVGKVCLNTTSGNTMIGTTTDAGYRLDVNGTARVSGAFTVGGNIIPSSGGTYNVGTAGVPFSNGIFINTVYSNQFASYNSHLYFANSGVNFARFTNTTGNLIIQNGGTYTDDASARLTVNSTTQGFLPPRMTTTQKNAIATPAAGLVVYDTTLNKLCVYTTAWETITSL